VHPALGLPLHDTITIAPEGSSAMTIDVSRELGFDPTVLTLEASAADVLAVEATGETQALDSNALDADAMDTMPAPPSTRVPKSAPPPLPEGAGTPPPSRAAADNAFADQMMERLAAGDYEGATLAANALLEYRPRDQDALDCAQIAQSELRKMYVARLGSIERVPRVVMGPDAVFSLQALDFRAGYLLSRVDGVSTLQAIVESGSIPSLEALRILSEMYLRRVIDL
jgi:hypothetical protein